MELGKQISLDENEIKNKARMRYCTDRPWPQTEYESRAVEGYKQALIDLSK